MRSTTAAVAAAAAATLLSFAESSLVLLLLLLLSSQKKNKNKRGASRWFVYWLTAVMQILHPSFLSLPFFVSPSQLSIRLHQILSTVYKGGASGAKNRFTKLE